MLCTGDGVGWGQSSKLGVRGTITQVTLISVIKLAIESDPTKMTSGVAMQNKAHRKPCLRWPETKVFTISVITKNSNYILNYCYNMEMMG